VRVPGGGQIEFGAFLKRLYRHYDDHAVSDTAAALSYYFLFALFPFLFFLATLTAYLPLGESVNQLIQRIRPVLPAQAVDLISEHVNALIARPHPKLLTVGLIFTLYSASRGIDALRKGFNLAYDVKETRPLWHTELLAVGATLAGAALVLFGVAGLVAGGDAGFWLARHIGIGSAYVLVWRSLRWPVITAVIMLLGATGYYVLPNVKQKVRYIMSGTVTGTVLWLGATWGFSLYAGHFGTYNVTYGSIGGVVILMTLLFISGFILLMGCEINAILEHASVAGKEAGAHAEGEVAPPPDERPSVMPAGAAGHATSAERSKGGPESGKDPRDEGGQGREVGQVGQRG
jgi:membrane protein